MSRTNGMRIGMLAQLGGACAGGVLAALAACGGGDGMTHDAGASPFDSGRADSGAAVDPCGATDVPACFAWASPLRSFSDPIRTRIDFNDIVVSGEVVVVVGGFLGEVDFGTGVRRSDPGPVFTDGSLGDIFAAAYDRSSGRPLWTYTAGQGGWDEAFAAALDADGNVWITGTYQGPLDAAGMHLDDIQRGDMLVMRLDAATGVPTAAWSHGARSPDIGLDIEVSRAGFVDLTGIFDDFASFGGSALDSYGDPIFVASYDLTGAHRWSVSLFSAPDGFADLAGPRLAIDDAGGIFVAGSFNGTADLAGARVTSAGASSASAGAGDIFVLRLNDAGGRVWTQTFGNTGEDNPTGLLVAGSELVLAGQFEDSLSIAGSTLYGTPDRVNTWGAFLAGLSTSGGAAAWAMSLDRDASFPEYGDLLLRPDGELVGRAAGLAGIDLGARAVRWRRDVAGAQALGADPEGNLYVAGWTGGADLGGATIMGPYIARFSAVRSTP